MRKLRGLVVALAGTVVATGCGGSAASTASPEAAAAVEAAAAAEDALAVTDSPITTEVLNVADGTATTLQDAVDGDRAVLLWFWAPH